MFPLFYDFHKFNRDTTINQPIMRNQRWALIEISLMVFLCKQSRLSDGDDPSLSRREMSTLYSCGTHRPRLDPKGGHIYHPVTGIGPFYRQVFSQSEYKKILNSFWMGWHSRFLHQLIFTPSSFEF